MLRPSSSPAHDDDGALVGEKNMERSIATRPVEDYPLAAAGLAPEDEQELADCIRANFSELSELLNRLGDLYGDTLPGARARAAAAAAKRARVLANRLP